MSLGHGWIGEAMLAFFEKDFFQQKNDQNCPVLTATVAPGELQDKSTVETVDRPRWETLGPLWL